MNPLVEYVRHYQKTFQLNDCNLPNQTASAWSKEVSDIVAAVLPRLRKIRSEIRDDQLNPNNIGFFIAMMLLEESCEHAQALEKKDEAEIFKELCDIVYLAFGMMIRLKLPVEAGFLEVHMSNMTKTCGVHKGIGFHQADMKKVIEEARRAVQFGVPQY